MSSAVSVDDASSLLSSSSLSRRESLSLLSSFFSFSSFLLSLLPLPLPTKRSCAAFCRDAAKRRVSSTVSTEDVSSLSLLLFF